MTADVSAHPSKPNLYGYRQERARETSDYCITIRWAGKQQKVVPKARQRMRAQEGVIRPIGKAQTDAHLQPADARFVAEVHRCHALC